MAADPILQAHEQRLFADQLHSVDHGMPMTRVLIAINVLVFGSMAIQGYGLLNPSGEMAVHWGSNFGPLTLSGQWWRLVSSLFIHFGLLHLAVNMWSLNATGALVERLYGRLHFLVLYLVSGVCASLASVTWNPMVNSAGASGAVFGVVGGLLAFTLGRSRGIPRTITRQMTRTALLIVVLNLGLGATQRGIDNAAHIGGLIAGLAAGLLLARPLDSNWRKAHRFGGIGKTLLLLVVVLVGASLMLAGSSSTNAP